MKKNEIEFTPQLNQYILSVSLREHPVLKELRERTNEDPNAIMQIPPEQGQFMAFLLKLTQSKRVLEIGTYTGYSTLSMALALEENGKIITCDINNDWAHIGKPFWKKAGMEKSIDLRIAPALDTMQHLLDHHHENSFDFIFIDADKINYINYYEYAIQLLKPNGIIAIDNVLLFGSVLDMDCLSEDLKNRISKKDVMAIKNLNLKIKNDPRVDLSMLPMADGLTLVRKK